MLYDQITTHDFSLIPKADVPRSVFKMKHSHKTAFDAGYLYPIYCEELLPGDSYRGTMHAVARMTALVTPFMDDLTLESFFFFVPSRLLYDNFQKLMGERRNPADSISYVLPTMTSPAGGYAVGSLQDYFGLPTAGQITGSNTVTHQSLPLRAYNRIYNEWFRDQNLINSATEDVGDGPDNPANYVLRKRGKRHDYFTSCLPWPQKGDAPTLSMGGTAPVFTSSTEAYTSTGNALKFRQTDGNLNANDRILYAQGATSLLYSSTAAPVGSAAGLYPSNLFADLSQATAQTINSIRTAFQIQRLLERDARGGTRYTEIIRSHFGVVSPDARLQRPEYIGGGSTPIVVNGVPQTSSTDGASPQGNLAATGTMFTQGGHDFSFSSTEHGYIIGIVNVRGELTYQQGLRRMWSRSTRYDFYFPAFSHLGEQAVLNKEIYTTGTSTDDDVFGYQERYGEYRFHPSQVTGRLRSTAATSLDVWHLAQEFSSLPTLNQTFIEEAPPVDRVVAIEDEPEFVFDGLFEVTAARSIPMYGVPGLIDHF